MIRGIEARYTDLYCVLHADTCEFDPTKSLSHATRKGLVVEFVIVHLKKDRLGIDADPNITHRLYEGLGALVVGLRLLFRKLRSDLSPVSQLFQATSGRVSTCSGLDPESCSPCASRMPSRPIRRESSTAEQVRMFTRLP